jgi:hypothetical protein
MSEGIHALCEKARYPVLRTNPIFLQPKLLQAQIKNLFLKTFKLLIFNDFDKIKSIHIIIHGTYQ